jgi:autotransporter-associated beta strand protein
LQLVVALFLAGLWLLSAGADVARAATLTWVGDPLSSPDGTWDTATADWTGGSPPQVAWTNNDDAAFVSSAGTVLIGTPAPAVHSMAFTVAASGFSLSGTNAITLAGSSPEIHVDAGGVTDIDAPLAGTAGMIKSGGGQLILGGTNAYTGGTTLAAGALQLAGPLALPGGIGAGGTSNLTFAGTGSDTPVLELASGDFTRNWGTAAADVQFTGSGGFAAVGASRIVNIGGLSAQVTWGAVSFVLSGSTLVLGSPTADNTLNFQNPINLVSAVRTVLVNAGSGSVSVDAILSGALSGPFGGLIQTGDGTLELAASNNSYTGGTTIGGGTLQIGDGTTTNGSLPGNVADYAALVFADPGSVTYSGVISGYGSLGKSGSGTLTLSGSDTFTGGTRVSRGLLLAENYSAIPAGSTLAITASGSVVLGTPGAVEPLDLLPGDPPAGALAGPLTSQPPGAGYPAEQGGAQATPEPGTMALLVAGLACGSALWLRAKDKGGTAGGGGRCEAATMPTNATRKRVPHRCPTVPGPHP